MPKINADNWWQSKETAAYVLAAIILMAWLGTIFLHYQEISTLTNVVMIIVGYIWGSSTGSKSKDTTSAPSVAPASPVPANPYMTPQPNP